MRHRRRTRRLGCETAHREAMLRNMVTSLLEYGRIVTTVPRAKEVCRLADRMVTLAKDGGLHARRQASSVLRDRKVLAKLFDHWGKAFASRNGGYSRIIRKGPRRGDAAMLSVVEMAVESLERPKSARRARKTQISDTVIPQAPAMSPAEESAQEEKVSAGVNESGKEETLSGAGEVAAVAETEPAEDTGQIVSAEKEVAGDISGPAEGEKNS
jgi:large subunit ribosomal protein L17